jgi:hypothetical protein
LKRQQQLLLLQLLKQQLLLLQLLKQQLLLQQQLKHQQQLLSNFLLKKKPAFGLAFFAQNFQRFPMLKKWTLEIQ